MARVEESTITVKGQATIPRRVREHLGLRPGDRLKFFVHPDGTVVLLPKAPASALRGTVRSRRGPVTLARMRKAIEDAAIEEAAVEASDEASNERGRNPARRR